MTSASPAHDGPMSPRSAFDLPVMSDPLWQMTYGERFALEGLLTQLQPSLAIETGTADGGSLRRIAAHADEVHAFDIAREVARLGDDIPNATIHIGDSAVLLPRVLGDLAAGGRHVDFALIDGDHSYEGVRRDATAVVDSDACRQTVIVFHDTANAEVRAGLESLDLAAHDKVALCIWDFVPGYLVVKGHPHHPHAAWNGLGLVILGGHERDERAVTMDDRYSVAEVYGVFRDVFDARTGAPAADAAHGRTLLSAVLGALAGATVARLLGRTR